MQWNMTQNKQNKTANAQCNMDKSQNHCTNKGNYTQKSMCCMVPFVGNSGNGKTVGPESRSVIVTV